MKRGPLLYGVLGLAGAATLLLLASEFAPLAVLPVAIVSVVAALAFATVRTNVLLLTALTLVSHSPQDNPAHDQWVSPLEMVGKWLLRNLSANLGSGALGFALIDVWVLGLLAVVLLRGLRAELPPLLRFTLGGFLVALLVAGVQGVMNGGSVGIAYWQVRQLLFLPVFVLLLMGTLADASDLRWLGRVVVATAAVKAVTGIYFYVVHCLPSGIQPPYVTTHHDSLHFVVALAILLAAFLERPVPATRRLLFALAPLILGVMVLNNRRLGFIALIAALTLVVAIAPRTRARLSVLRMGLLAVPLALIYCAAGWTSQAAVFRPAQMVRSVFEANTDDSTAAREIENRNLVATIERHPLGIGLGTAFDEVEKGPDISALFELYLHIPHNSVLWLLAAFGPLGFLLMLAPLGLSAYYAMRAHMHSVTWVSRVAAVASIAAIFGYLLQAWGDMGTRSWTTTIIASAAIAAAARCAVIAKVTAPAPVAPLGELA